MAAEQDKPHPAMALRELVEASYREPVEELTPTLEEAVSLARMWYREILTTEYYYYVYGAVGGRSERITYQTAGRRLSLISQYISEEIIALVMEEIELEIEGKFGITAEHWKVFREGTDEERLELAESFFPEPEDE